MSTLEVRAVNFASSIEIRSSWPIFGVLPSLGFASVIVLWILIAHGEPFQAVMGQIYEVRHPLMLRKL